jgi:hypothetical protein
MYGLARTRTHDGVLNRTCEAQYRRHRVKELTAKPQAFRNTFAARHSTMNPPFFLYKLVLADPSLHHILHLILL